METIELVKNIVGATQKTIAYVNKRAGKRTKKRKKRKMRFGTRVTIFAAVFFACICLLAGASFATGKVTTTQAKSEVLSPTDVKNLTLIGDAVNNGNKLMQLNKSASAVLTMYNGNKLDALSSAMVDENTGEQHYMRYVGSGGVAESTSVSSASGANKNELLPCPEAASQQLPGRILKYFGSLFGKENTCEKLAHDFLTSPSGILFNFPAILTYENPAIQNIFKGVQLCAFLFLTPVIMLIGFNLMGKFGNAGYADVLETLPRLLLSLIGVSLSLFIAQQLLGFGDAVLSGLWGLINASGVQLDDINNVLFPVGIWKGWLTLFFVLSIGIFVAQGLSTLSILGTDFGAFITVAADATFAGLIVGNIQNFVILGLSMIVGAEIIIRILLLNFYIIMSPIALVAAGLPGQTGVKVARDWIYGFFSLIASQVAQVAVLGIGLVVLAGYKNMSNTDGGDIIADFIKFGTLALMVRVPALFKSNAVDLIKQVGPMVATSIREDPLTIIR